MNGFVSDRLRVLKALTSYPYPNFPRISNLPPPPPPPEALTTGYHSEGRRLYNFTAPNQIYIFCRLYNRMRDFILVGLVIALLYVTVTAQHQTGVQGSINFRYHCGVAGRGFHVDNTVAYSVSKDFIHWTLFISQILMNVRWNRAQITASVKTHLAVLIVLVNPVFQAKVAQVRIIMAYFILNFFYVF